MAKNKYMAMLSQIEGAVTERVDPFKSILQTDSPSANFIFGNSWGLPLGYTAVVFGLPKGGKSLWTHMVAGYLHKHDPEALVVKFDTEFRTEAQLTEDSAAIFGIDLDRIQQIQNNDPTIFDDIEKRVAGACEAGAPIKLVIIDSLYGIRGRRSMDADSVEKQIIGDHALTLQEGLKRIIKVQRKYGFAVIMVDQVRSEMDMVEQKRGNKFKMRSSFAVQHHAEYFIECQENRNKDGKIDLAGNEFVDEDMTDLAGNKEITARKFRIKMRGSSMGPSGRTGEYTFDFRNKRGVINIHEEVFRLAKGRGVINRPNAVMYEYGGQSWRGEAAAVQALENSPELQQKMLQDLMALDKNGVAFDEE